MTYDAHLRTRPSYSNQKSCVKIWFGLVEPFKSYHVHKQTNIQCGVHFPTWLSYFSQKSCVKILFGLVEIGGM